MAQQPPAQSDPELSTGHAPAGAPIETRTDAPHGDPIHAPADAPGGAPRDAPGGAPIYAVEDAGGVVVGLTHDGIEPDTPAAHVVGLIRYAIDSDGLRGRWVLASVLRIVYRRAARSQGVDPLAWPTVATVLSQLIPPESKWVRIGGRRRRRRAYLIPECIEDVIGPPAEVVRLAERREAS
jgi:hypothetical protein